MTTAYTSLLGLALPVTGELSGTWGDTVNNSITSLLDTSVAGTTNVSTDTDVTLTTTTGAANTARQAILLFSGARTALRTVTAPAQSKVYTVINATTGGFSVKLVGAGPTTGVTIVAGESAVCAWNGSDFVKVSNTGGSASFVNLTASGTVTFTGLSASQAVFTNASDELVSNAITGTGNVVMSASPTLTGTISAAALTASGNVTLSGGTANGVAYLNGSKVVTSGSALTFDGTNLGVGAGSALTNITINGNSSGGFIRGQRAGANQWFVGDTASALGSGTGLINFVYGNDPFIWYNGGTSAEQMRLTSTGLGIGTSSPAYKLQVASGATSTTAFFSSTSTTAYGATGYNGGGARIQINGGNASGATTGINFSQGGLFEAYFGGVQESGGAAAFVWQGYSGFAYAERMRLDSSGNLGLGVTPSAYTAGKAIDISSNGGIFGDGVTFNWAMGITQNAYRLADGSFKYKATGQTAGGLEINGNTFRFLTAPSGTAGNAITFTQAMSLTADGNLLVGATSNSGNGERAYFDRRNATQNQPVLAWSDGQDNTGYLSIRSATEAGENGAAISADTALFFGRMISGTFTERARITSAGNLGIGTTAPAQKLVVYDASTVYSVVETGSSGTYAIFWAKHPSNDLLLWNRGDNNTSSLVSTAWDMQIRTDAAKYISFATNSTERARITSTGNMIVGGTSDYGRITATNGTFALVTDTASQRRLSFWSTANGDSENAYIQVQNDGATTNTGEMLFATRPAGGSLTERARITAGGNFFVGATTVGSDANYFACSPGNAFSDFGHGSGVASGISYTRFLYAGGVIGSITQSGTTAVLYNTTSDQRLKENIQDAENASTLIDSLQVRQFDWKADGSHQRYGFIAQELATVAPEAVHQPADPEEMMAVDYSKLVPMLVKEIQSLRKRLADAGIA